MADDDNNSEDLESEIEIAKENARMALYCAGEKLMYLSSYVTRNPMRVAIELSRPEFEEFIHHMLLEGHRLYSLFRMARTRTLEEMEERVDQALYSLMDSEDDEESVSEEGNLSDMFIVARSTEDESDDDEVSDGDDVDNDYRELRRYIREGRPIEE